MRRAPGQVWDLATYAGVALLSLGVFAAYNDRATAGSAEQAGGTLALLLAYGAAVIPASYACSFGFASPSAAQARQRLGSAESSTHQSLRMLPLVQLPQDSCAALTCPVGDGVLPRHHSARERAAAQYPFSERLQHWLALRECDFCAWRNGCGVCPVWLARC